ncbi:MAG: hypothetical protein AAGJ82_04685 [Bacteroidota bacterium]
MNGFHSFERLIGVALALVPMLLWAQTDGPKKVRLPAVLAEVSGLYIQSPDSLWWHNDSGGSPELFLTNREGELLSQVTVPTAINRDWEDLTADDQGYVYVGDFGDNRRRRTNQCIYRFRPGAKTADSIAFRYPNDRRQDLEAFFWHQDSLHLFTKSRIRRGCLATYHYVVPAQAGTHTASLRDSVTLKKRVVTAAAIDRESGRVVLLTYYYKRLLGIFPFSVANVFFLDDYPDGHFLRGRVQRKRISFLLATQYESVDFLTSDTILVASEKTVFIAPKVKRVTSRGTRSAAPR